MSSSLHPHAPADAHTRFPAPHPEATRRPDQPRPGQGDAAAQAGPPAKKPKPKGRDPYFDNAKYLAIVLVACGHAWEPLRDDSRAAAALYMIVYAFHMPAFIMISGFMSRNFDMTGKRIQRLVTGVLVPYILFEIAYTLFKRYADDDPGYAFSILDPWYLTWFLIALFVWRVTTPIWRVIKWPVPLALAIAALAAMSPEIGDDLDLQRVLQFMPFFVIGLFLKPEHFQLVHSWRGRFLSMPVFAVALLVAYWAAPRMSAAWFYRRDSAQELQAPHAWYGGVMTLALFGASMVLCACFFAWVPRRKMWFTVLGAGTLYGYLLHGFIAKGSRFWGWYEENDWVHTPLGAIVVTFLAAGLITFLCTPPFQRAFRWAMEPKMDWAFKKDAGKKAEAKNHRGKMRSLL
ncbi:acyltransferase family protein [Streptomyces sp. A7024]|uniref:Acyltransferase family protein n=1 Tax=Streptomyces coryli TaxID=1128680 RepID=A0A6G4TUQ6_9ACTN|nr:acyltransferase family protein [Streptomyces coryli]